MTDWQPIETAPRDGTQILVLAASPYGNGETFHLVTWHKGWEGRHPGELGQPACWWANENGQNYHEPYVQKWMPLPPKVPLEPTPKFRSQGTSMSFSGAGMVA